jgi:hypothetical protein
MKIGYKEVCDSVEYTFEMPQEQPEEASPSPATFSSPRRRAKDEG